MRWIAAVVLGLTACAQATTDKPRPLVDAASVDDAPDQPDALEIDAGPTLVTLSQTADTTVAAAQSLACGATGSTNENSWYRVFKLADAGITTAFHVTSVQFAVQEASASQSVQLKIGTYAGTPGATLNLASITPLTASTLTIAVATDLATINAPIDAIIPAGATMIVELFTPDHTSMTATYFYAGATAGAETQPGYLRAPACGVAAPQPMKVVDMNAGSLIMNVTGTHP
ncbi:MAG: hypothetical protein NT062_23785 [Proteobacteria bacterium]|nr:hypothetical protein [Pseudomonadota bacterium]